MVAQRTRPERVPAGCLPADLLAEPDDDPGDPEPVWILVPDAIGDDDVDAWVIDSRGMYSPLEKPQ